MEAEVDPKISEYMSSLGKKGGQTMKGKYGKEFFSEIGRKGANNRWSKVKNKGKETDEGIKETEES